MPNKLTDAEVKKALKEYIEFADFEYTEYTSIRLDVLKNALELINRQEGEKEKNENIIRVADKTIATLNAENESLKAEVERLSNNISAMATTLSTSARATRHEAYKNCVEKSEKAIFIKQDDRRKEMLEILKTYRTTPTYSDTEQATDNWLRGYGEAVQDVLGVFYNLYKDLVGDENRL